MQTTITATFEDGVLKPTQPLDLPDHATVRVTIEPMESDVQKNWNATREERLAAFDELMKIVKPHSGPILTREQLHERR